VKYFPASPHVDCTVARSAPAHTMYGTLPAHQPRYTHTAGRSTSKSNLESLFFQTLIESRSSSALLCKPLHAVPLGDGLSLSLHVVKCLPKLQEPGVDVHGKLPAHGAQQDGWYRVQPYHNFRCCSRAQKLAQDGAWQHPRPLQGLADNVDTHRDCCSKGNHDRMVSLWQLW